MGHYYFDSSALVKRYVAETGTDWMNWLCAVSAGHIMMLSNWPLRLSYRPRELLYRYQRSTLFVPMMS